LPWGQACDIRVEQTAMLDVVSDTPRPSSKSPSESSSSSQRTEARAAWYREHLGVPVEPGQCYGTLASAEAGEQTVWSTFPADTSYFGSGPASFMVNYRVRDLDAMLAQLRAAGAQVEERVEDHSYGRFGWATGKVRT